MALLASYVFVLSLAIAAFLGSAYWVWRKGRGAPAVIFAVLLVWCAWWTTGMLVQATIQSESGKFLVFHLWAPITWLVPITWFVFTIYYTGRHHWLSRRAWAVLGTYTLVVLLVTVTNTLHNQLWRSAGLYEGLFPMLVVSRTPVYYVILSTSYVMIVVGLLLLAALFLTSRRSTAVQAAVMLFGVVLLLGTNAWYTSRAESAVELNPTPIAFGLFLIALGWSLFRQQLFGIVPFARDTVLAQIDEGMLVVDTDGYVSDYNRQAEVFFPALDGSIGERLPSVLPELLEDRQWPSEPNGSRFVDRVTVAVDGEERTIAIQSSPLSVGSTVRAFAVIFRDVTALESYAERLERQNEQLDRFASTVSHDIRSPLSVATGYVELAEETGSIEDLDHVRTALDRIDELVDDVLTLTREGQEIDSIEPVPLVAIAEDAWTLVDTGSLAFDSVGVADEYVLADRRRLQTIFENVFRNAVEHADGATRVRLGHHEDGFYVEDDGPGIPEERRDHAFEPGESTSADGTGLGLAIVSSVAEAHGWTVRLTDGTDGGARFEFGDVGFAATDTEVPLQ